MVGVPIIAQNVSAIPETVGPGGLLIDPDRYLTVPSGQDVALCNTEAFSEAILEMYQSPDMRKRLGEAGRQHVLQSFSWDAAATRFDEFIQELAVRETPVQQDGSERGNDARDDHDGRASVSEVQDPDRDAQGAYR
jgi:glycosyltransferase involved in cell wall biosynthesis